MNKGLNKAVATAAVGMIAGTAAYMMSTNGSMNGKARKIKRSANKAVKNAEIILSGVSQIMK